MNALQRKIIVKALDAGAELSEWEHDFVAKLADKLDDYSLSEKQNHALNEIWGKIS